MKKGKREEQNVVVVDRAAAVRGGGGDCDVDNIDDQPVYWR